MAIEVSSALVDFLLAETAATHPREACGLLFGEGGKITAAKACANVHPTPETRFEIEARALVEAHRAARTGGPKVLGYWHSHPHGPPQPSAADRANATGDGMVWAIVGERRVGWWRDDADGFEALSYRVDGR